MKRFITIVALFCLFIADAVYGWELPGEQLTPSGFARNASHYIQMPDGVMIAVDVWLPENLQLDQRVPVVIESTRYWRAAGLTGLGTLAARLGVGLPGVEPGGYDEYFPRHGYAMMTVDVRGTGASSGVHSAEYSREERLDYYHIIEWAASQPWSSGEVFGLGVSYSGTSAELMTTASHPALRAVAPLYSDFDAQLQLARPGGIYQPAFIEVWSELVSAMDRNELCGVMNAGEPDADWLDCVLPGLLISGVKPVDGAEDFLDQAVAEHNSPNVARLVQALDYRDSSWGTGETRSEEIMPYGLKTEIETSQVPMFVVSGWFDAATANGSLARFATFQSPQEVWIGPFSHGGEHDTDPYKTDEADALWTGEEQLDHVRGFFDRNRLGVEAAREKNQLHYYINGLGEFRTTDHWPPDHLAPRQLFLGAGKVLDESVSAEQGSEIYAVNDLYGTSELSRWLTQMGGTDVIYNRQKEMAGHLLAFTSAPFAEDTEITGSIILDLWLASDQSAGALHAYLLDVAPDGTLTYLSEGMLDLQHRMNTADPDYPMFGPWHSFTEADAAPLPVNVPVNIKTTLFATSAMLKQGHRLRIALAGGDKTSFQRIPRDGPLPQWRLYYGSTYPSSLTVFAAEQGN